MDVTSFIGNWDHAHKACIHVSLFIIPKSVIYLGTERMEEHVGEQLFPPFCSNKSLGSINIVLRSLLWCMAPLNFLSEFKIRNE